MRLQHHCYDSRIEVFDLHVRPVFRDVRALLEYTGVRIPEYMYTCIREYTSIYIAECVGSSHYHSNKNFKRRLGAH